MSSGPSVRRPTAPADCSSWDHITYAYGSNRSSDLLASAQPWGGGAAAEAPGGRYRRLCGPFLCPRFIFSRLSREALELTGQASKLFLPHCWDRRWTS
jgi:hypothetical protein